MESLRPVTVTDFYEGDILLTELELKRDQLIAAGHHALAARAGASPFHPANAAGYFSYADGVKGLRLECIGDDWEFFRSEGVEGICNKKLKKRVLFANVHEACGHDDPRHVPEKVPDQSALRAVICLMQRESIFQSVL